MKSKEDRTEFEPFGLHFYVGTNPDFFLQNESNHSPPQSLDY
jgi:hypothetical protein